jgi:hypothetical protein
LPNPCQTDTTWIPAAENPLIIGYLGDKSYRVQQLLSKSGEGNLLKNVEISAEMKGPNTL